jgi:hypothetical protein
MTVWNQAAEWSSGNLIFQGSTSAREIVGFHGDTVRIPSARGRVDANIVGTTSEITSAFSIANPTTVTLCVEGVMVNIATASATSGYISLGIGAINSSGEQLTSVLSCSTTLMSTGQKGNYGFITFSSGIFPVEWTTSTYFTGTVSTTTGLSTATLRATASAFYVTTVVT